MPSSTCGDRKLKNKIEQLVYLFLIASLFFPGTVSALSREQKRIFDSGIYYFNTNGGEACSSAGVDTSSSGSSLDITSIANKYSLQSAIVMQLGGSVIGSYNADEPPVTPASTMKLVIASTLLKSGLDLGQIVDVTRDLYYNGNNDLGTNKVSLQTAMDQMLSRSSNVGANVIMKALGGVGAFTDKANSYGYTHTKVGGYYDPKNDGKNSSTISDQAAAMNDIFSKQDGGYRTAQDALQKAAVNDNHYGVNDDANKWAGTSQVAGNVGKFKVGGKDFIIGLYINKPMTNPDAISGIKNGSEDLAQAAGSASGASQLNNVGASCCSIDSNSLVDSPGAPGVYSSGLQPPYIIEQYAIAVLKDLAQKKGVDEASAVTKEHVLALVTWAYLEGGDTNNSSLFNLYNTGYSSPELNDGAHTTNGLGSYKSFDAGVEATARTLAQTDKKNMAAALLTAGTTAKQFGHAESYSGHDPGTTLWAEAAYNDPSGYEQKWRSAINNVRTDYQNMASLVIGTPEKELLTNRREPSKLDSNIAGSFDTSDPTTCGPTQGAVGIAAEALKLSWPDDSHGTTPTPEYQAAYNQFNPNGPGIADCGGFVATVMHATVDKDYPAGGTSAQEQYVRQHPEKYDVVDKVNRISDLQPGDIMIVNQGSGEGAAGHTYIFVGSQPPNNYDEASASLGSRAANLGKAVLSDSRGNYLRARLK